MNVFAHFHQLAFYELGYSLPLANLHRTKELFKDFASHHSELVIHHPSDYY